MLPAGLSSPSTSGRVLEIPHSKDHCRVHSKQIRNAFSTRKLCRSVVKQRAVAESDLISWLGLQPSKLLVAESSDGSLEAAKEIQKNSTVLSIPASKWITQATVAASPVGPAVSKLQPWLQITLFLMYEKANPRSEWRQYIACLPDAPDTPLLWSEGELETLLGGTQLIDNVLSYRQFFQRKFQDLEEQVFSSDRQLFADTVFTQEEFTHMAVLLRSRIHPPLSENEVALVPLADKVQHQRGEGVVWKLKSGGFGRGEKALIMEAQRNFEPGQGLTMDFGADKLDSDLLLNYGVLDEFVSRSRKNFSLLMYNIPNSCQERLQTGFPLTLAIPEDDRFIDDKADILDINGFQDSHEFILSPSAEPTVDMLAYLRLINLSGTDAFLLESLFRNEAWGFLQMPVSLENENAVFTSMIEGCREALQGYGSSTAEDKARLKSAEAGSRGEKALRICIGEKEALAATLQFFEDKIERLDQLEYYQERRLKGLGLLDDDGRTTYDSFFKDGIA